MVKGDKKISIPQDNLDDYSRAIGLGYRTVDNTKIKMSDGKYEISIDPADVENYTVAIHFGLRGINGNITSSEETK